MIEPEEVGIPSDPVQRELYFKLGELAGEWGETKSDAVVQTYHTVLKSLFELGWDGYLLPDEELPEELMPDWYLEYYKAQEEAYQAEQAPKQTRPR